MHEDKLALRLLTALEGELRWCARLHANVNDEAFVCYDSMADGLKEISDELRAGKRLIHLLEEERFKTDWAKVPQSVVPEKFRRKPPDFEQLRGGE